MRFYLVLFVACVALAQVQADNEATQQSGVQKILSNIAEAVEPLHSLHQNLADQMEKVVNRHRRNTNLDQ
ncbi:hypothetical protein O3M35_012316 [Rhynocoris fuscipes]|uniref:Uncharacterized protein n=1 Tax=Rhynocoris fuscipes TaxID=488301 RepID=A0AAW1CV51_9HEMI